MSFRRFLASRVIPLLAWMILLVCATACSRSPVGPSEMPAPVAAGVSGPAAFARTMTAALDNYAGSASVETPNSCAGTVAAHVKDLPTAGYVNRFQLVFTDEACLPLQQAHTYQVRVAATVRGSMEVELLGAALIDVTPGDPAVQREVASHAPGAETRAQQVTVTRSGRHTTLLIEEKQ